MKSIFLVFCIILGGCVSNSDDNTYTCPVTTCCDGTCSNSTGSGTCSYHGGICKELDHAPEQQDGGQQ